MEAVIKNNTDDQTSHNGHKKLVRVEWWPSQSILNKSQCMDSLPKNMAVVKRWPLQTGGGHGGLTVLDAKRTLIQAYIVKNKIKTEHSSHAVFCLVFFCSNFAPISYRTNLQISYIPFSFAFIPSFISFLLQASYDDIKAVMKKASEDPALKKYLGYTDEEVVSTDLTSLAALIFPSLMLRLEFL